jgi:uncharacterized BrkB/YihY/UPF0761 family membrane protein
LELCQHLFGIYLTQFISFNAVYGVFGTIMALLFWIYFSGAVVIFGGCIAATAAQNPKPVQRTPNPLA